MQHRRERLARAVVSAGVCSFATACAHDLGGGQLPPPALLALVFALSVPVCLLLGGRRVTLTTLTLAIGASQALLHTVFDAAGSPTSVLLVGDEHTRHHGSGAQLLLIHADHSAPAAGHSMLLHHALAGLATVAALRLGTGALRRIAAAITLSTTTLRTCTTHALRAALTWTASTRAAALGGTYFRALLGLAPGLPTTHRAGPGSLSLADFSPSSRLRTVFTPSAHGLRGPPAALSAA